MTEADLPTYMTAGILTALTAILENAGPSARGVVYRHYDSAGALLYIGSADELTMHSRQQVHAKTSRWWPYVARTTEELTSNRATAYQVERAAIAGELPIFNLTNDTPERVAREAAYVKARGSAHELPRNAEPTRRLPKPPLDVRSALFAVAVCADQRAAAYIAATWLNDHGMTFEQIAERVRAEHGVDVHRATVARWAQPPGPDRRRRKRADGGDVD